MRAPLFVHSDSRFEQAQAPEAPGFAGRHYLNSRIGCVDLVLRASPAPSQRRFSATEPARSDRPTRFPSLTRHHADELESMQVHSRMNPSHPFDANLCPFVSGPHRKGAVKISSDRVLPFDTNTRLNTKPTEVDLSLKSAAPNESDDGAERIGRTNEIRGIGFGLSPLSHSHSYGGVERHSSCSSCGYDRSWHWPIPNQHHPRGFQAFAGPEAAGRKTEEAVDSPRQRQLRGERRWICREKLSRTATEKGGARRPRQRCVEDCEPRPPSRDDGRHPWTSIDRAL